MSNRFTEDFAPSRTPSAVHALRQAILLDLNDFIEQVTASPSDAPMAVRAVMICKTGIALYRYSIKQLSTDLNDFKALPGSPHSAAAEVSIIEERVSVKIPVKGGAS